MTQFNNPEVQTVFDVAQHLLDAGTRADSATISEATGLSEAVVENVLWDVLGGSYLDLVDDDRAGAGRAAVVLSLDRVSE